MPDINDELLMANPSNSVFLGFDGHHIFQLNYFGVLSVDHGEPVRDFLLTNVGIGGVR